MMSSFGPSTVLPLEGVRVQMPVTVGDYADLLHRADARRMSAAMFRPDAPPHAQLAPSPGSPSWPSLVVGPERKGRDSSSWVEVPGAFGPTRSLGSELEVAVMGQATRWASNPN
jgi:hypothetical protein